MSFVLANRHPLGVYFFMTKRPISVIEMASFLKSAQAAGLDDAQRAALVSYLAYHPLDGAIIRETGGVRKIRWAPDGTGKSGGYRAIYFYYDEGAPVFAMLVYGKSHKTDLDPDDKKAATKLTAAIKAGIRAARKAEE